MASFSTHRALPRGALVARFALIGFFAGLFAWVLVLGRGDVIRDDKLDFQAAKFAFAAAQER